MSRLHFSARHTAQSAPLPVKTNLFISPRKCFL